MTVQSALKQGCEILLRARVDTPLLDSTVLLAHALAMTKEKLYASLPEHIDDSMFEAFNTLLMKRCNGTPISYIRNLKEFYELEFYVDERVLVPRPDTEIVIDTLLKLLAENPHFCTVHDLCTGSGCIAITLKHLEPRLTITASDISPEAGEVFRMNAMAILGADLSFYSTDLLDGIDGPFDIIVSNPPYLTDKEVNEMKAHGWPEPALALAGGITGTGVSLRLIRQASKRLNPGGFLVMESCPLNMDELKKNLENEGFIDIVMSKDLGERDRVITGRAAWET